MNISAVIKLVIRNLLARKGRSLLTILGIVIGVAGVIIIIALGAGAQSMILGQVTKLGSNLLFIEPTKNVENGAPTPGLIITTLINNDVDALRSATRVPHASAVNASVNGLATVTWGSESIDTNFTGTDYTYPQVTSFTMQAGQFFSQQEDQGAANVVVLGSAVSEKLFGASGVNPIGQVIKVKSSIQAKAGGVPLRVIGVIAERGSSFFQNQDEMIFLPLTLGQEQILGIHYLQGVYIKVDTAENVDQTIADVNSVLTQQHHIKSAVNIDFAVRNQADAVKILSTITNALSLFLIAMAGISLVVGGIGILNIMMVTVGERTREIGLRKAVGATNRVIRNQFLLEAGMLTGLGGIIGIIIGVIISYLLSLLMNYLGYDWAFVISWVSIVLAVGVSVLTGVIFGLLPAFKAAKLDPIEALRYE